MHHRQREVPSLMTLCINKLQRRFDQVYYLSTSRGDLPSHLLKQIIPKTVNFLQLEKLVEYNPHMEYELNEDLNMHYRTAALKDFVLLRKEAEHPDFQEPASWRELYLEKKKERDDKLIRARANIKSSYKDAEQHQKLHQTKSLQHAPPPPKKSWWGHSAQSRPTSVMGRAVNAVKKEMKISTIRYDSSMASGIGSSGSRALSTSHSKAPVSHLRPPPKVVQLPVTNSKPKPAVLRPPVVNSRPPAVMMAPAAKSFSLALPK
ncbi:hypothetical protein HDU79_010937 [Rhizoclosmatium sp. JEL0117]|nr:hypothetical protein HDU79_010937 [Rhizoclosmatium sp. JEL0117]